MVRQWQNDVREKHHCLTSNKWCSDSPNDKIMLEKKIILYVANII